MDVYHSIMTVYVKTGVYDVFVCLYIVCICLYLNVLVHMFIFCRKMANCEICMCIYGDSIC
jgi:hypothetical protein